MFKQKYNANGTNHCESINYYMMESFNLDTLVKENMKEHFQVSNTFKGIKCFSYRFLSKMSTHTNGSTRLVLGGPLQLRSPNAIISPKPLIFRVDRQQAFRFKKLMSHILSVISARSNLHPALA